MSGTIRCQRPGCDREVYVRRVKDARWCGDACRQWAHRHGLANVTDTKAHAHAKGVAA